MRSDFEFPGIVDLERLNFLNEFWFRGERVHKLERAWGLERVELTEIYLNGHPQERLSNNLNVSFAFVEGKLMMA